MIKYNTFCHVISVLCDTSLLTKLLQFCNDPITATIMFSASISKLRLCVCIIFCIVVWKTVHYFSQLKTLEVSVGDIELDEGKENAAKLRKPVTVTIYYEALCSDSRNFILKQLVPTHQKISNLIDVELVPYGKATTTEKGGTYVFECQHSYIECDANKVHACVLKQPFSKDVHIKYVACMIRDNMVPHDAGQRCAEELNVDYEPIRECANGAEGSRLLKEHGERTHAVSPKIAFIPTVQLNHSSSVPLVSLLKDLLKEVCNFFKDQMPEECS